MSLSHGMWASLALSAIARKLVVLLLTLLCAAAGSLAQTGPAQKPLLNRDASGKPNILFVLDNSSSMSWKCIYLPHVVKALEGAYTAATLPGQGADCITGRVQDSPANNALMYDPAKRYFQGYSDTGTQLADASGSGAVIVYLPKQGVDITKYTTTTTLADINLYDKLELTTSKFRWNNGAATLTNPLPKAAGRDDCQSDPCTYAEESQNVANWRRFHQSRLLAAKTGIGFALQGKSDTFRLGWAKLAEGTPAVMKIAGVKDYGLSKGEFYKWLNNISADNSSGTLLRTSLDFAGKYYERTDNAGPWGHKPWAPGTESATDHLSCRRSFTILSTDGFWNDSSAPASVAGKDIDGTAGPVIKYEGSTTIYQFTPHNLTDARSIGKSDSTVGGGNAGTLADIALYYWSRDLRGGDGDASKALPNKSGTGGSSDQPFWQNMTTYSVSFGAGGVMTADEIAKAKQGKQNWSKPVAQTPSALDDLIHAAHNGGGEYLSVRDATSFGEKLGSVIDTIVGKQYSEAGVAASATTLTDGTTKIVPYYTQGLWWGNLKMFNLSDQGVQNGLRWQVVATGINEKPTGTTTIPAFNDRNIWAWVDASKHAVEFKYPALKSAGLIAAMPANNAPTLLKDTVNLDMVDYFRGSAAKEGSRGSFRERVALLGDIVNSTPVFVKSISNFQYEKLPAGTAGLAQYDAYMKMKSARKEGVVFVGANDGMVHAFREGLYPKGGTTTPGGAEVFAYVPRAVLGNMHQLADKGYQHQYFVDGPLVEADAWVQTPNPTGIGASTGWRNLIVGTTGAGAKAVFALNATDPLNMNGSSVLWEVNDTTTGFGELGYVLAPVQTGIMQDGTWVGIFGNGYYSKSSQASLFVVDLATGALIKRIDTAASPEAGINGLGGVRLVLNANRQIMGAYAGDLKGRVWKFDFNSPTQRAWKLGLAGKPLYTALDARGNAQPITAIPAVIVRNDMAAYQPSYMVVVGTGKLIEDADAANNAGQAAYGLWDQQKFGDATAGTTITSSQLVQLTTTGVAGGFYKVESPRPIDWSTDRGWTLPYSIATGQRTIYAVETLRNLIRIDTVAPPPPTALTCDGQTGLGYNFIVSPLTGLCKAKATLDINNDGVITADDGTACGYTTIADGEDAVLSTSLVSGGSTGGTTGGGSGTGSTGAGGTTGGDSTPGCNGSIYSIQNSTGQRLVDVGCEPHASLGSKGRAWRQIFMRAQ